MKNIFIKTVMLGMSAGMRTMAPLAIMSARFHEHKQASLTHTKFNFIQSGLTSGLLGLAAFGELAGDKSEQAPNRTEPLGIIARAISGAFVGAAIYKASFNNPLKGAAVGAISAVASTYAFFYLRKKLAKKTGKDKVLGMAEDVLAYGLGNMFY
ncbi:DUF4126 family protein [Pedobacter sp. SD-b]|uniref:DUF4126 family protein n=1 Tax=Pedobacter segetis TaxID=2793069 RepID=A0ABS1BFM9_9SPHI|nr:DUF4126 family protein [Pedobacter segetis]MBK0381606.1 DUF4126 family protein [Pedobacter segetis]